MSANIKASVDGTQAIIGVGGVDQMTVSNAGVVTANSFVGNVTGGGTFSGNASSATALATGSTTARTLATRFADVINVKDFGAVGDGVADDTDAIQAAIVYAESSNKGTVFIPDGMKILIDSNNLTIPNGVRIISNNLSHTYPPPPIDLDNGTCIFLNPLYTIKIIGNGCGITGINILRKGVQRSATAPSSFAGTAITIQPLITPGNADDCYIANCGIFGFNQAIYGNWCGRYTFENIVGDNTNGIFTENIYDVGRARNIHFWPYLTSNPVGSPYRNGTAFYIKGSNDWSEYCNCFCYGYETGYRTNASSIRLTNCGADGLLADSATTKGYWIEGYNDVVLIGCRSAIRKTNYYIDSTRQTFLQNCSAWGATEKHIHVTNGIAFINDCYLYEPCSSAALTVDSGVTLCHVSNTLFDNVVNTFNINSSAKLKTEILENCKFVNTITYPNVNESTKKIISTIDNGFSKYAFGLTGYQDRRYYANGSPSAPTSITVGQPIFQQLNYGYDGTDFVQTSNFRSGLASTASTNIVPSNFIFSTTNSIGTYADRIIIQDSGNLLPLTDNVYQLGANGNRWSSIWSANGTIQTSDERVKKDIEDSNLGLDFVKSLHPVSYKWIEGSKKVVRQVFLDKDGNEIPEGEPIPDGATPGRIIEESIPGERTHFGLLAQEVKAALPEGVDFGGWVLTDKENPDSQQALRYDQFIAPLIKAVQEQQKQIEELSAEVAALKSK